VSIRASFIIATEDAYVRGSLGVLEPNRRVTVHSKEPVGAGDRYHWGGLLSCKQADLQGEETVFYPSGKRQTYRKGLWRRYPSDDKMWDAEFPHLPLERRRRVAYHFPLLTQP
jgi:hypothetical protein